jgi:vesicle coat complex subunit
MGTTKVFLNLTKGAPRLHEEVYRRLKAPLLTLMGGSSVELTFAVLGHILILVERSPGVFNDAFKHFFCRFNEPVCVKKLKLSIITSLANDRNMSEIINELAEYVTDVDADIARTSIRSIGRIAIKIDLAADEAVEHLLSFLDLNMDYVTAETCIVLKDLLRKYPERYEEVIPALQKCLKTVDETEVIL